MVPATLLELARAHAANGDDDAAAAAERAAQARIAGARDAGALAGQARRACGPSTGWTS